MKAVICGAIKNCGKDVQNVYNNMLTIASLFVEYKIIFSYDHSHDNTLSLLRNFKEKNPNVIIHVNNDKTFKDRTHNLAKARNAYVKIIRDNYSHYDYMFVIDCDEVSSSPVKLDILKKHLNKSNAWDILSFNKRIYYDSWALSIAPYFINCHLFGGKGSRIYSQYVSNLLKRTPPNQYLRCLSAFNGFAIYKIKKILNCSYNGTNKNISMLPRFFVRRNIYLLKGISTPIGVDCEHKHFHFAAVLKNKAKCRITPDIIFESKWGN